MPSTADFERAVGGVTGGMAEQAARRRRQDDLAAAALLEHLPAAARAISQDWVTLASMDVEEILRLLIDDLRHLVLAGRAPRGCRRRANRLHRGLDDRLAIGLGARPLGDAPFRLCRRAFRTRPRPSSARFRVVGGEHDVGAGRGQRSSRRWHRTHRWAPLTIAVLPLTLNRESGSFRKSSDIGLLAIYTTFIRSPRTAR